MWPDRRLCDLLGIEHPIIQAPMSGSTTPELAAAVCEGGGLGSLGCATMDADQIRDVSQRMRSLTNRAFNLNFFVHPAPRRDDNLFAAVSARLAPWRERLGLGDRAEQQPDLPQGFDAAKLALLLELRPPVVSFHFGLPDQTAMAALKSAGIIILSTASNVAEARSLEAQGC